MKKFLKIFVIVCISFLFTGCDIMVGYVDKKKKLSEKEIGEFILNDLKTKYNQDFSIVGVKSENMYVGCHFSLDGTCFWNDYIKGAKSYQFTIESPDKEYFRINYEDAYKNIKENKYYDTYYLDTYKYVLEYNADSNSIKDDIGKILNNSDYEMRFLYSSYFKDLPDFKNFVIEIYINENNLENIENIFNNIDKYVDEFVNKSNRQVDIEVGLYFSDNEIRNIIKDKEHTSFYCYDLPEDNYDCKFIVSDSNKFSAKDYNNRIWFNNKNDYNKMLKYINIEKYRKKDAGKYKRHENDYNNYKYEVYGIKNK